MRRIRQCMGVLSISIACSSWAMDLQQAYVLALQNEPGWASAQARFRAASELPVQARAAFLPSLQVSGSRSASYSKDLDLDVGQDYAKQSLNFNLRQVLYGKVQSANMGIAQAQLRQAEADLETAQRDLMVKVSSAYVDVLYADQTMIALNAQREAHEGQLAAAKRLFEAGQGTRTDIDEATAQRDITVAQVLSAQQQQIYARNQLALLVGRQVDDLQALVPSAFKEVDRPLAGWVDLAKQNSPEVRSLRARVGIAQQAVEKTQGERYPKLDLVASWGRTESETLSTAGRHFKYAQVGVEVVMPLYNGGAASSAIRQAVANVDMERAALKQGELSVALAVRKEYQALAQGRKAIGALEVAVKSAQQMRYGIHKGIQAGTRSQTDLLNAIKHEAEVARQLAMTRYQAVLASIRLHTLCDKEAEYLPL